MKTSAFNFNRIGLLFQRYFYENFISELIYWGVVAIVFMYVRNHFPSLVLFILITGAIYAARYFRETHSPKNGIAYFMIPATQLEKLFVAIVMTSMYYFLMMIIAFIIGNFLGSLLNNMLASINHLYFIKHTPLSWEFFNVNFVPGGIYTFRVNYLVILFVLLLFTESIFLLGSIYFKKNNFFLTFLTGAVTFILLCFLFYFTAKMGFVSPKSPVQNILFGKIVSYVIQLFIFFLIPFFWIVTYFRLTEKQV